MTAPTNEGLAAALIEADLWDEGFTSSPREYQVLRISDTGVETIARHADRGSMEADLKQRRMEAAIGAYFAASPSSPARGGETGANPTDVAQELRDWPGDGHDLRNRAAELIELQEGYIDTLKDRIDASLPVSTSAENAHVAPNQNQIPPAAQSVTLGAPAQKPGMVRVKPLEWSQLYEDRTYISCEARSLVGRYSLFQMDEFSRFKCEFEDREKGTADTLDAAKTIAQADYEARILSAIEVTL